VDLCRDEGNPAAPQHVGTVSQLDPGGVSADPGYTPGVSLDLKIA
jgi:hypothetical protein